VLPREAEETVRVGQGVFHITYAPDDAGSARRLVRALEEALPVAERWATLSAPVEIRVHPSHEALETATGLKRLPWVRAWARPGTLDVQSPRTWSSGASEADLRTLIAHELTHCVVYQATLGHRPGANDRMPLWFREGMASVTAGEYHRSGYEALFRFYRDRDPARGGSGGADPLSSPAPLMRSSSQFVYGTAHLAFQFLLDRAGEESVRGLILRMGEGLDFEEAFQAAMGLTVVEFEDEFRGYVEGRGWSGGGLSRRPGPSLPVGRG